MVKWIGSALIMLGATLAAAGFIPVCFALCAAGGLAWAYESLNDTPLLVLNAFLTVLNSIAFLNN